MEKGYLRREGLYVDRDEGRGYLRNYGRDYRNWGGMVKEFRKFDNEGDGRIDGI